ncbi:MAG: hypothetical protein FJZ92_08875 [Chloroflexi bacterium]|nr:hypothetical protein [Chloroflexota bacterium]
MRQPRSWSPGVLVGALALSALLVAACGGGGEGGGGARDTVKEWIEGWERTSGPQRDDITAGQMRRLLGGELKQQTEGVVVGGANPQSGAQLGTTKRLDKIYSEFMSLPIPPDKGFTVVSATAEGDSATVVVKFNYSDAAAGVAAASGIIPFEKVNEVNQQVISGPQRTFTLEKVEGAWLIMKIAAN